MVRLSNIVNQIRYAISQNPHVIEDDKQLIKYGEQLSSTKERITCLIRRLLHGTKGIKSNREFFKAKAITFINSLKKNNLSTIDSENVKKSIEKNVSFQETIQNGFLVKKIKSSSNFLKKDEKELEKILGKDLFEQIIDQLKNSNAIQEIEYGQNSLNYLQNLQDKWTKKGISPDKIKAELGQFVKDKPVDYLLNMENIKAFKYLFNLSSSNEFLQEIEQVNGKAYRNALELFLFDHAPEFLKGKKLLKDYDFFEKFTFADQVLLLLPYICQPFLFKQIISELVVGSVLINDNLTPELLEKHLEKFHQLENIVLKSIPNPIDPKKQLHISKKIVQAIMPYFNQFENKPKRVLDSLKRLLGSDIKNVNSHYLLFQLFLLRYSYSDEAKILLDLNKKLNPSQIKQLLKGAHIRIEDNGDFYRAWSELKSARERISSHPSIKGSKQYGVMDDFAHEILFGIVEKEGKTYTFLQFENTPWAPGIHHRVNHSLDAFKYVVTRKNVGPYGQSIHTDRNVLYV